MAKTKQRHETPKFERAILQKAQKELVALAEKRKMSQSDIAAKLGWAPQHAFRGLKEGVPSLRVVTAIAKALGLQVELRFVGKAVARATSKAKKSKPTKPKAQKPAKAAPQPEKTETPAPPASS